MNKIAIALLLSFFWGLFGFGKEKTPEVTVPPVTEVVTEATTEPTEPTMSEEEYDKMIRKFPSTSKEGLKTKLVCYWSEDDLYNRDFIPEAYIAERAGEVRALLLVTERTARQDYASMPKNILNVTIKDIITEKVVAEAQFEVIKSTNLPGSVASGYSNPEVVMEWVESVWEGYASDVEYDHQVNRIRNGRNLTDSKLACYDMNKKIYLPRYIPQDLMAQSAKEVKGVVRIFWSTKEYYGSYYERAALYMDIYDENGNRVTKETLIESELGKPVEADKITQWIQETWDKYGK